MYVTGVTHFVQDDKILKKYFKLLKKSNNNLVEKKNVK